MTWVVFEHAKVGLRRSTFFTSRLLEGESESYKLFLQSVSSLNLADDWNRFWRRKGYYST